MQTIADYVNDQLDVNGRAILGLTLGCARCRDHKFDPISTRDYYSLAGIFFSSRLILAPIAGNIRRGAVRSANCRFADWRAASTTHISRAYFREWPSYCRCKLVSRASYSQRMSEISALPAGNPSFP